MNRTRKQKLAGWTYQMKTGCGPLYITINEDEMGLYEIFISMGKAGGCASSQLEAVGRVISLALKNKIAPEKIIKQIQGISCHAAVNVGENKIRSCSDAIAQALKYHTEEKKTLPKG